MLCDGTDWNLCVLGLQGRIAQSSCRKSAFDLEGHLLAVNDASLDTLEFAWGHDKCFVRLDVVIREGPVTRLRSLFRRLGHGGGNIELLIMQLVGQRTTRAL